MGSWVSLEQLSLVPRSEFLEQELLSPVMTTPQSFPEPQVLLLECDLHYRNTTKEVRIGNAHVGIHSVILIIPVSVDVAVQIERLGPFLPYLA